MHANEELKTSFAKHMFPPTALGSKAASLSSKVAALCHAWRLEAGSEEALRYFFGSCISFTTDAGVESQITEFPAIHLDSNGKIGPLEMEPAGDSAHLFPHTVMVCGMQHILANAAVQIHEHMQLWTYFVPLISMVAKCLHARYFRDRFKAFCVDTPDKQAFLHMWKSGCPLLIQWRWLNTIEVLRFVLASAYVVVAQAHGPNAIAKTTASCIIWHEDVTYHVLSFLCS